MENHPIPQDVTGFQFKLIGNMTVKQFAYLATGGVLAVIFYYAPIFILLKIIFIPLFVGLGAALAFLPIEGRPMDLMLSYFIKDLFSPTQYVYQKTGGKLPISLIDIHPVQAGKGKKEKKKHDLLTREREVKLHEFLSHIHKEARSKLDEKEALFLQTIFDLNARPELFSTFDARTPLGYDLSREEAIRLKIAQSPEDREHELEKEAEAIKKELSEALEQEQHLKATHQQTTASHAHITHLEQQLNAIMQQKQQLERELLKLKEQLQGENKKPRVSSQPKEPLKESQNVRIVPTEKAPVVGLPSTPDVPNIVLGIIKDPRGNVLPNILVEIKDKDGNPVRAFKTNGLGQFASATPLQNGTYTITFEDPKGVHKFEVVALEAKGEILLPLEIISQDAREELRRELFG